MTRYTIDAPTLLALAAGELTADPGHQLVAPSSVRSEALELLLADVQAGRRTSAEALRLHDRMTEIRIRALGDRVSRRTAWKVALEQDWPTLRDAEYVAVTRLQADALVTLDPHLAARAEGLVPLGTVAALAAPPD